MRPLRSLSLLVFLLVVPSSAEAEYRQLQLTIHGMD
jgi:hypothetical protein